MLNNEFICWINGYLALSDDLVLNGRQIRIIKSHANLALAVAGHLEPKIQEFLTFLEECLDANKVVSLLAMRQWAEECFLNR